ncbi:MAPEG family protein, partial [Aeromonas rivipollensis]
MMHITLIYGGLLGLLFLLLSFWVVKRRAQFKVMIGEGEAPEMLSAIRAHGNFAEYVPLTLLLMALCELAGVG